MATAAGIALTTSISSFARAIEHYILAKDGNRPDLLRHSFTPQATLEMTVHTEAISFPSLVNGRAGIADVLVRRFGQIYENVYTFCLGEPPQADAGAYACKWLVGMSVKENGALRVGCGEYQWRFDAASGLVEHLSITIEQMQVCAADDLEALMNWLQRLDYPWCKAGEAVDNAPDILGITAVIDYLKG
jgi:hypothetical protein